MDWINKIFHWTLSLMFGLEKSTKPAGKIANTKKSEYDSRDHIMSSLPVELEMPESYSIPNSPPIRNQGSIGSCASHVFVRAYEYHLYQKGTPLEGSEMYHYYMSRKYVKKNFPADKGQSMRDAAQTLLEYGFAPEVFWKYNPSDVTYELTTHEEKSILFWALRFQIKEYQRLIGVDMIKESLYFDNIPVCFAIHTDTKFYRLSSSDNIWNPTRKGTKGGHALIIVGWTKDGFLVENSWGRSWSRRGTFILPFNKVESVHTFDYFRIIV